MEIENANVKHRPLADGRKNSLGENKFELPNKDDIKREDAEMLKARIKGAETLYQIHDQARSQISEEITERKMDRDRVTSELKYGASGWQWHSYRNIIERNNKEIKRLQCALYNLDDPKQVTPSRYQIKHGCNTRAKERQLVREIKETEAAAREKLAAHAAVKPTRISLSSREDIEDRIEKRLAINRDEHKKSGLGARSKVEHLQRELEAIEKNIRRLETQLVAANQKKSHAYKNILELKKQRDQ